MTEITIRVGRELFRFHSHTEWVNKAQSRFEAAGLSRHDWLCVDAAGRLCRYGLHFMRAKAEGTFPVVVYHCDAAEDGGPPDAL